MIGQILALRGLKTSWLQITLKNGESIDEDCGPAIAGSTGDDCDVLAEMLFGAMYVDKFAASSTASSLL